MHPFQVTDEIKAMVVDNICYMFKSFLSCFAFENIFFCWVMHEQSIIDNIISHLDLYNCKIINISLICTEDTLRKRLQEDIDNGIRAADVIDRSIARIPMYEKLDTIKIDILDKNVDDAAEEIMQL